MRKDINFMKDFVELQIQNIMENNLGYPFLNSMSINIDDCYFYDFNIDGTGQMKIAYGDWQEFQYALLDNCTVLIGFKFDNCFIQLMVRNNNTYYIQYTDYMENEAYKETEQEIMTW